MLPPPHPVIHNFRYKASEELGNEYHIKRKLCIMEGEAIFHWPKTASDKKVYMYHKVN